MALLLLESCSQVPVKDEIMYGNKGMEGAVEYHTLTSASVELTFEQWMQLLKSQPMVCTSVQTVADIKSEMEQLCTVCNCCDYDQEQAAEALFNKLQVVKP